jgi:hypothetical protein
MPNYRRLLHVAAGGLGAAGTLVLIGYIATAAHSDLLGIRVGQFNVAKLGFSGGDFLLDSLIASASVAAAHWVMTIIFAVALIFILLIPNLKFRSVPLEKGIAASIAVLVLVGLAGTVIYYELPTIEIRNLLIGNNFCESVGADVGFMGSRTEKLSALLARAHGYNNGCERLSKAIRQQQWEHDSREVATTRIEATYVLSLAILCLAWTTVLALPEVPHLLKYWRAGIAIPLVLGTLFLPYVYGKLIATTVVQRANLVTKTSPAYVAMAAARTLGQVLIKDKTSVDTHLLNCPAGSQCFDAFILAEDDQAIYFCRFDEDLALFLWWPKASIDHYETQATQDVISERIRRGVVTIKFSGLQEKP